LRVCTFCNLLSLLAADRFSVFEMTLLEALSGMFEAGIVARGEIAIMPM
jgi:hypothetical protein